MTHDRREAQREILAKQTQEADPDFHERTIMQMEQDFTEDTPTDHDPVNHPFHYTNHPSGVECIDITEHMGFNLGNAVKYIWRNDLKSAVIGDVEDLRKAQWYLEREIKRRKGVSYAR